MTTARAYREALQLTIEVLQTTTATAITAVHHPQLHVLPDTAEAVVAVTAGAVPAEVAIAAEAVAAHQEEGDRNNH